VVGGNLILRLEGNLKVFWGNPGQSNEFLGVEMIWNLLESGSNFKLKLERIY
jgi:hypothetical protein